jgi:hypothetical protein
LILVVAQCDELAHRAAKGIVQQVGELTIPEVGREEDVFAHHPFDLSGHRSAKVRLGRSGRKPDWRWIGEALTEIMPQLSSPVGERDTDRVHYGVFQATKKQQFVVWAPNKLNTRICKGLPKPFRDSDDHVCVVLLAILHRHPHPPVALRDRPQTILVTVIRQVVTRLVIEQHRLLCGGAPHPATVAAIVAGQGTRMPWIRL